MPTETNMERDENLIWEEDGQGSYRIVDANEDGIAYLTVSIGDPVYQTRTYTAEEAKKPALKTDPEFWTSLANKIRSAAREKIGNAVLTEEEKKAILLEHFRGKPINEDKDSPYPIRENIAVPRLDGETENFLYTNLRRVFEEGDRFSEKDFEEWGTRSIGVFYYAKNKLGFREHPDPAMFTATGIMEPDQELKLILEAKQFVEDAENDPEIQKTFEGEDEIDPAKLSHDKQEKLVKRLVAIACIVKNIPPDFFPEILLEPTSAARRIAEKSRQVPGSITVGKFAFGNGMMTLNNCIFHEVSHAYQHDRRSLSNSKQTPMIEFSTEEHQRMREDRRREQPLPLDEKLLVNISSIHIPVKTYFDSNFATLKERECFLAGAAAGCFTAGSKIFNPQQTGILKNLNPEEMIGGFENKFGQYIQNEMGVSLRQIVARPGFIDSANNESTKCAPVSVKTAMTGLLKFKEIAEQPTNDPIGSTHALLSCLPELVKKSCDPQDQCYAQAALLVGIIRYKERLSGGDAFIACIEQQNPGFKFSTDANNLEMGKLKELAQRYPDNLSRAILAEAAWRAIGKPKNISCDSIAKTIMQAPRKKEQPDSKPPAQGIKH